MIFCESSEQALRLLRMCAMTPSSSRVSPGMAARTEAMLATERRGLRISCIT
jgi:hypothetical protein